MRRWPSRVCALSLFACVANGPGVSAAEDPEPRTAELLKEAAYVNAKAALTTAEAAAMAAKVAPLKELAGDGKTTLGTGAGATESWILVGQALKSVATRINKRLGEGNYLLLAGDEALDFRALRAIEFEAEEVDAQLAAANAAAGKCAPDDTVPAIAGAAAIIGTVGSLLRSTTDIQGIDIKPDNRLLVAALAQSLSDRAIVPSSLTYPSREGSSILGFVQRVQNNRLGAIEARDCAKKAKKPADVIAALDAAITRSNEFTTAITKSSDAGRVRLADALALEALLKSAGNGTQPASARIVRLYVDKAGGTTITRKNLWTALGAKAVGVTGGIVASFISTDVATGKVHAAGVITCRTAIKGLNSIHNTTTKPSCSEVEERGEDNDDA